MNALAPPDVAIPLTHTFSEAARRRMLSQRGEPLFIAGWRQALMIHFEVTLALVSHGALARCQLRSRLGGGVDGATAFSLIKHPPRIFDPLQKCRLTLPPGSLD